MTRTDRARAALYGLAIGDALGMPTQLLSRPEIAARYGGMLTGFEPGPPDHPIAAGLPAGIASRGEETLVDDVVAASRVTHNTSVALAGAAAVAAAVRAGVHGASVPAATDRAIAAAREAAGRGYWVAGANVAARIEWATALVAGRPEAEAAEVIYTLVGTSLATQESVPAAFAVLAAVPADPWRACLLAASLGGDCDTIAAIAGAVASYLITAKVPRDHHQARVRGRGDRGPGHAGSRPPVPGR